MSETKKKKHPDGNGKLLKKNIVKYILSALIGLAAAVITLAVLAAAYYKMESRPDILFYLSYLPVALGGFLSGRNAFERIRGRGITNGITVSLIYSVLIVLFVLIMNLGAPGSSMLLIIPISMLSGAAGGITAANKKVRH